MKQLFNAFPKENQGIAAHTLKGTGARNDGSNSFFRLKKNIFLPLLIAVMTVTMNLQAQVKIGEDKTPEQGALLDLNSAFKGGLLLPNVSITNVELIPTDFTASFTYQERDVNIDLTGTIVYNTNAYTAKGKGVYVWDGYKWDAICAEGKKDGVPMPVPIACPGSNPKPVVWMSYNLGASSATDTIISGEHYDLTTPKGQMKYLAVVLSPLNATKLLDSAVYGGLWQWGRRTDGHQKRTPTSNFPTNNTTASQDGTQYITWASGVYDHTTGQIIENVNVTTAENGTLAPYGKFIKGNSNINYYDWIVFDNVNTSFTSALGMYPARWGNGVVPDTPTGATDAEGNPWNDNGTIKYYQKPVKHPTNDPCPSGWRVPTQDEWETLGNYCDAHTASGEFTVTNGVGNPANNPDLYWVAVVGGKTDKNWAADNTASGYAIYNKIDWLGADGLGGAKAYAAQSGKYLYDDAPDCPSPLLFLPVAGSRLYTNGKVDNVGDRGFYWSSTVSETGSHCLFFTNEAVRPNNAGFRAFGFSVRCVAEFL
jgi:hypothetical protein